MKKKIVMVLSIAMVMALVLSGCSKSDSGSSTSTATAYKWSDYIDLPEYKELPFYTEEYVVTDEEVDFEIESMLQYATTTDSITEGVVEDGDTINVSFVGKINGEEFEGGSSESYDITIGTTSMIDGFVEGLVGKNIGETVTLNLKFPDDYHAEDLQGKDVVFDVTIKSKQISKTPEFNDDFAKEYYDVETADALREQVKQDLLKSKEEFSKSTIKNSLWSVILEGVSLKSYPQEEEEAANAKIAEIENEYRENATSYGIEWADFLKTFMGTDEAGFQTMMDEYKESLIKNNLITKAISEEEGITLSDTEYKDRIKEILESNNLTEDTFKSYYNQTIYEYAEQNDWRNSMLLDKVMDKVLELGKEVTKEEFDKYIEEKLPQEEVVDEPLDESTVDESATEDTTEDTKEDTTEDTKEDSKEG